MNSLRLTILTVAFFMTITMAVPIANRWISDACQKNLIQKPCISCEDSCSSIDNNTFAKWTTDFNNVLSTVEGIEVFENYLQGCNFTESLERLYMWKESNTILHNELRHNNQTERKEAKPLKRNLFVLKDGKAVPFPREKLHHVYLLQNTIREVLSKEYKHFKSKLVSDKIAVDKYSAYTCGHIPVV